MAPVRSVEDIPPEQWIWINGFAAPPAMPIRPVHALVSVLKLIRNKEDTRQVFEAVSSLAGRSGHRLFERLTATEYGRRAVSEPVKLEDILSDREALRAMPDGSLGRAYLAFMEGENLTADGLLDAAEEAGIDFRGETQFEEYRRMFLNLDVAHDLWHVLTGYGRDALGEGLNLIFTRTQTRNPGFRLIVWIGLLAMKAERPGLPVYKAARQARVMGEGAGFLVGEDIEALLPMSLTEVRRRLNITEPTIYNAIPADVKKTLLQPKVKATQAERERAAAAA